MESKKKQQQDKKSSQPKLAVKGDFAKVFKILAKAKKQPVSAHK